MTGDATNTDPVCELSPHHALVTEAVRRAESLKPCDERPLIFRSRESSARLTPPR
jgi:pyrroloquinoline quinone biosynthesis protein E